MIRPLMWTILALALVLFMAVGFLAPEPALIGFLGGIAWSIVVLVVMCILMGGK